jgi:predicted MPP superfamily phosphohydrolase
MAFGWHSFSWILLLIDAVMLLGGVYFVHGMLSRIDGLPAKPSRAATVLLIKGSALALTPWVVGGILLGGILGLCLVARSLWTLFTLGLPVLGGCLWRRWRAPWTIALVVLPLLLKLWGEFLEPRWLEVERVQIPVAGLPAPLRIVHLSDLQTDGIRDIELRARAAANAFAPHVVVFTGDILNHASLRDSVREYLQGYSSRGGNYFVSGNVDQQEGLAAYSASAGFKLLDGSTASITIDGVTLGLTGLGLKDLRRRDFIEQAMAGQKNAHYRLLLSHYPDAIFSASGTGVNLVFAGHTHGGQVSTPLGPIITLSRVARTIAAGGLHAYEDLRVSVSRGLGWEGHIAPRVRLFARPHIILLELVPQ